MRQETLTQARLKELVHYDPETGVFTSRVFRGGNPAGKVLGSLSSRGYMRFNIEYRYYSAHRLAWFYVHGEWPEEVDHKNGVKHDNRIANLRPATSLLNKQNKRRAQGANPLLGASWNKRKQKWKAAIRIGDNRRLFLGYFDTAEAAHEAYVQAKRIHHPFCTI